jgi:hypothetical protein
LSGITVELFRKYGLGALFTVVVLFVITWIVTHVMAGPGGTVSVWGLVEYTKDAGVEKELRHELEERKNHIQKLEAALQAKEVQLSNAASCIQNKKELEEELDKVRTEKNSCEVITTQMQEKDSVKIQLFKRIATLQKELNMKSVLRKENIKKIKNLNKELAIHKAKCIPVERVVTVEVGICAVYECKRLR